MFCRYLEKWNQVFGQGNMVRYRDLRIYWFYNYGGFKGLGVVGVDYKGLKFEYVVQWIREEK